MIAAAVAILPLAAACGGLVEAPERSAPEDAGSQGSAAATTVDAATGALADVGAATDGGSYGQSRPGSGAFPCLSNTAAYYSDEGEPPSATGCRDLYEREKRHAPGCVISIVAPTSPGGASCAIVECICGASGGWEPSDSAACRW